MYVVLIDRQFYIMPYIELNFNSLYELFASNSTALGSVLITSDYYGLARYQTHEEQIIRDNVLTIGLFQGPCITLETFP